MHACPPIVLQLHRALVDDGYTEAGAVAALDTYIRHGSIAASDRVILGAHHGISRTRWISGRWGEAAGVAEVAYEQGIGGEQP